MSVPSRGRYVPHSAPLTARNLRSPQDRNRLRPLARPTPPDLPRRSMSASTIRLVRHSIPLSLSIVGRPHQAGPIRSWRADSLVFVWLDPGITPCCKSLSKILRAADGFYEWRREGPYRFIQNRSRAPAVALKPTQEQRSPKINFREIFRVVRFSTFATISVKSGPQPANVSSPLISR